MRPGFRGRNCLFSAGDGTVMDRGTVRPLVARYPQHAWTKKTKERTKG